MVQVQTTAERIQFVRNRIAERRAIASDLRAKAIGNTVTDAANCLEQAKLAEAHATGAEIALRVLFP